MPVASRLEYRPGRYSVQLAGAAPEKLGAGQLLQWPNSEQDCPEEGRVVVGTGGPPFGYPVLIGYILASGSWTGEDGDK